MSNITTVATRSAMAALTPGVGDLSYLSESGREGAFKWSAANHSADVSSDVRQGVFVPPASDTTGASGSWVRVLEEDVNVKWFGAVADNSTDDYPAFAAAIAFCLTRRMPAIDGSGNLSSMYGTTPTLRIPLGTYYLSQTLEIKGSSMEIVAVFGSILRFPANTHGIIIQSHDTTGETTGSSTTSADSTVIRGLVLRGGGGGNLKHGLWLRASAQIYNCSVLNFAGDGIHIVADVHATGDAHGNANGWTLEDIVVVRNGRDGLHIDGGDVNAGTAKRVNASSNGRFGVFEGSFLANTHIGHHCDSNGLIGAGPAGSGNTVASVVSHNGTWYAVVLGQDAAASTTTPGTNKAVWAPMGTGGATTQIPLWTSGGTYKAGGSYAADNPNARNVFIGCYEEGAQAQHQIMRPSIILGGLMTGLAPVATGLHLKNNNNGLLIPALRLQGTSSLGATLSTEIGSEAANEVFSTLKHSSFAPLGYKAKFVTASYFLPFAYNGSSSTSPFAITTPGTAEKFGRSTGQPHVLTLAKIAINGRFHGAIATTADLNGTEVAQGEIYYFTAPSAGGKLGVVCTTGGIVGSGAVLKEFGAIDA